MVNGWLSWVRDNDKAILTVLEEQADNLVKATSTLMELISNYDSMMEKNSIIKELEHQGDKITHKLHTIIDKTFVTPLDREDISKLTSAIDEVLDHTDGFSDRLILFKISKHPNYIQELASALNNAANEINYAVGNIRKLKNSEDLLKYCRKISGFEHEGDKIYRKAIAELFNTTDPIEIIKLKEVYETLEEALDRCADVADVIEDIALKYG